MVRVPKPCWFTLHGDMYIHPTHILIMVHFANDFVRLQQAAVYIYVAHVTFRIWVVTFDEFRMEISSIR